MPTYLTIGEAGFQKVIQLAEICAKHSDVFGSSQVRESKA